jgi:hypothetical protein
VAAGLEVSVWSGDDWLLTRWAPDRGGFPNPFIDADTIEYGFSIPAGLDGHTVCVDGCIVRVRSLGTQVVLATQSFVLTLPDS